MAKQEEHFETPAKRGTAIKQGAKNKEPEMTMEEYLLSQSQTMEQREQRYMLAWYLCRVVTEFAESKLV